MAAMCLLATEQTQEPAEHRPANSPRRTMDKEFATNQRFFSSLLGSAHSPQPSLAYDCSDSSCRPLSRCSLAEIHRSHCNCQTGEARGVVRFLRMYTTVP